MTPSVYRRLRYVLAEVCGEFYFCKHFHLCCGCRLLQPCYWLTAVLPLLGQSWHLLIMGQSLDIASLFQRRAITNPLSFVRASGFFPGCFPRKYRFLFLLYALGSLLTFSPVLTWNLESYDAAQTAWSYCVTFQMKPIEQYFVILYKMVLTFHSVNKSPLCDHSNQSYQEVLSRVILYYAVQGDANFSFCG